MSESPTPDGTRLPGLLLRLTIGPMLMVHGYNKVWGGGGLEGTGGYFDTLGLRPGKVHATVAAATELGAGGLMTLGALSPLPAAGAIGLMATASQTDHKGKGFLVFKGGWEYTMVVALASFVSAILGPGALSVDGARGKRRRGLRWGLAAALIGMAGAAGILSRVKPEPPPSAPEGGETS
jgi:putative oxidoreductase